MILSLLHLQPMYYDQQKLVYASILKKAILKGVSLTFA